MKSTECMDQMTRKHDWGEKHVNLQSDIQIKSAVKEAMARELVTHYRKVVIDPEIANTCDHFEVC